MYPIMTKEEHRTAWIKASYEVLGWWIPSIRNDWEWVEIPSKLRL